MAKVRGSKQHNMVIKPHQPHKRWLTGVAAFVCALTVCVVGFLLGQGYQRQVQLSQPSDQLMLEQLQEQVTVLEQGRLMDQGAVESIRLALEEKEQQIERLKKNLAFYKGVMAPEKNASGLQIDRLGIEKTAELQSFRIKWVLTQVGKNTGYLSGNVSLEVTGKQGGIEKVLSLKDVVSEIPNLKFKFRYFKSFSVQVELPENFVAEKVTLNAVTKGSKTQNVSQQYEWVVQETVDDVE